jgi:hypothetical protein
MLDAFASVDASGRYSSTIPSVGARFGTMVGGLTTGERPACDAHHTLYLLRGRGLSSMIPGRR